MTRNVYLGKTVKDIGKPGLDNLREVKEIAEAIIEDCIVGRISYRTAISRMNLLELIVTRDKDFQDPRKRSKARAIVDYYREKLIEECKIS